MLRTLLCNEYIITAIFWGSPEGGVANAEKDGTEMESNSKEI